MTTTAPRTTLAAVIAEHRQSWMGSFWNASQAINSAVITGKITPADLDRYAANPGEHAAERIATAAGLDWLADVDSEDVDVAVGALRALPSGNIGDGAEWDMPYPEVFTKHGTTPDAISAAMRALTDVRDAARLISEADDRI